MDELREINRLNDDWDALLRGETREVDPALLRDVMALRDATATPGPSPEFADRLWRELERGQPAPALSPRWQIPRLAIAAVLALVLLGAAVALLLRDDPAEPAGQLAAATEAPVASPTAPPIETPHVAGPTATAPPSETPQVAVVSPTPDVPATAAPAESPTPDPNATVPTGPTPPVQLGGGPVYETLDQLVNGADLIVLGRVTDEVTSGDDGTTLRTIDVIQTIRGDDSGPLHIIDYGEYQPGEELLLFLQRATFGSPGAVMPVGAGVVPVVDGVVTDLGDGRGWPIAQQYNGQPVEALIAAIEAIPDIRPEIDALVSEYDWTLLGRQSLWPRTLPPVEEFATGRVLPFMPYSWEAVNAASARIGLDFSSLAGQDTQIVVFVAERDPREERIQPIWFAVLVHDQQVSGAWVVVSGAGRPFGLDERDAALAEPAYVPTPAPTPTPATPSGETVNPTRLYGLANTETFTFCWPYCGADPQTVALRDALVAALDVELPIQPLDAHPTPTPAAGIEQADGAFVWLVFGYLTPGWPAETFGYDRDAGLLLLPRNAGWVPAPATLVEIMAGIEPPPLPTKPT